MKLLVVVLALVACSKHGADAPPAALDDLGNPLQTSPEVLMTSYLANEVAADHKYKDHAFNVLGTVKLVMRDDRGRPLAILDSNHDDRVAVGAYMADESDAARLVAGTRVMLSCVGDGFKPDAGPRLRGCQLR